MAGTPEAQKKWESLHSGKYRFGAFEVDLCSGELRKAGLQVKIQDQPLQVLSILLSRPGEVVTREEFRNLLWPADTFVDFEHGLNSAIKRLRHALDDDADVPRYIETLPRHGYRFIGPIGPIESALNFSIPVEGSGGSVTPPMREQKIPPVEAWASRLTSIWKKRQLRRYARFAALVLLVFVAWLAGIQRFHSWRVQKPIDRKVMLAVLPINDLEGDSDLHMLAAGMTEELTTQLAKAEPERFGVIARTSVEPYRRLTKPVSVIGKELGVDYVMEGSVRVEGNRVRIAVQLIRVSDQSHVWAEQYDRTLGDALGLQANVAGSVTRSIRELLDAEGHPAGG